MRCSLILGIFTSVQALHLVFQQTSVATGPKARGPAREPTRQKLGPARPVSSRPVLAGVDNNDSIYIIKYLSMIQHFTCMIYVLDLYLYGAALVRIKAVFKCVFKARSAPQFVFI